MDIVGERRPAREEVPRAAWVETQLAGTTQQDRNGPTMINILPDVSNEGYESDENYYRHHSIAVTTVTEVTGVTGVTEDTRFIRITRFMKATRLRVVAGLAPAWEASFSKSDPNEHMLLKLTRMPVEDGILSAKQDPEIFTVIKLLVWFRMLLFSLSFWFEFVFVYLYVFPLLVL